MADTVTEKAKRLAIKILEKDFDHLTAWQDKWSKKDVEFTLEEVIDYVMQTATVRIEALEKYAKKQKAKRKEESAKRPPKPKKVKAPKGEKKPRAKKQVKPVESVKPTSSAPASEPVSEPPEQTGGVVEDAPTKVEDPPSSAATTGSTEKENADAIEKVLAESRAAREQA